MRVVVCDPDPVFRKRLHDALRGSAFDSVEGVASWTMLHAVLAGDTDADIVLAAWPKAPVGAVFSNLRARVRTTKLVLLADGQDYGMQCAALAAGADGVLSKAMVPPALPHALLLVMLGETIFPAPPADDPADTAPNLGRDVENGCPAALSARECQVLSRLAGGQPNKMIARDLAIAEATVKIHVKNVLRKIGAQNRTQAALWAARHAAMTGRQAA